MKAQQMFEALGYECRKEEVGGPNEQIKSKPNVE